MTKAKYATPEYRQARRDLAPIVAAGEAWCVQGLFGSSGRCLYPTRDIHPDDNWDVAHDDDGKVIIGPAHEHCNRSDGGRRRHTSRHRRWRL